MPPAKSVRVLVVDDSAFMRRAITQMLRSEPQIDVVATGRNGEEAVELTREHTPDVITLDIEMPVLDGLSALRRIMRQMPTAVIMLSSLTTQGSIESLRALKLGAADVLAKDSSMVSARIMDLRDDLVRRVLALGRSGKYRRQRMGLAAKQSDDTSTQSAEASAGTVPASDPPPMYRPGQFDAVLIGSSTGGPPVVENLLSRLPAGYATPIVVAQHMPLLFTRSMAARLSDVCAMPVVHVEENTSIQRGNIYICPGGRHVHVQRERLAHYMLSPRDEPVDELYKPSVNVLFQTAAEACGSRLLAVVLTGIGEDGCRGAKYLVDQHAPVLAQEESSCVVYGMPKAVTNAGYAAARLTPENILQSMLSLDRKQNTQAA